MKKTLAILASLTLFTLFACSSQTTAPSAKKESAPKAETTENQGEDDSGQKGSLCGKRHREHFRNRVFSGEAQRIEKILRQR